MFYQVKHATWDLLYNGDLTGVDRDVYHAFCRKYNLEVTRRKRKRNTPFWYTQKQIAEDVKTSTRSVITAKHKLLAKGLIKVTHEYCKFLGRKTDYYTLPHFCQDGHPAKSPPKGNGLHPAKRMLTKSQFLDTP